MNTARCFAALCMGLSTISLAACDAAKAPAPSPPIEDEAGATGSDAPPAEDDASASPDNAQPESGVTDGAPDLTPAPLAGEAERGERGARNVLLSFIRALELKEFDQAYDLLRQDARRGMTKAQFAAQFDGFGQITVASPKGMIEGAAGTIYYTAPVTITGSNGQELDGEIVLSRVNDVPGASEEQLRWRVRSIDLPE
ncbi:hypothetical protein [Alteriqipengyuania sp.]|uniref:hypothetical protein n=2 Tax=Alteriqipengyuania sp. TaxID=2800692 RepID=UPI0035147B19